MLFDGFSGEATPEPDPVRADCHACTRLGHLRAQDFSAPVTLIFQQKEEGNSFYPEQELHSKGFYLL